MTDTLQPHAEREWQPARIADTAHILQFHRTDPGAVSRFAGKVIRVRRNDESLDCLSADRKIWIGCDAVLSSEVQPEDARELWPHIDGRVSLCEHEILTD